MILWMNIPFSAQSAICTNLWAFAQSAFAASTRAVSSRTSISSGNFSLPGSSTRNGLSVIFPAQVNVTLPVTFIERSSKVRIGSSFGAGGGTSHLRFSFTSSPAGSAGNSGFGASQRSYDQRSEGGFGESTAGDDGVLMGAGAGADDGEDLPF